MDAMFNSLGVLIGAGMVIIVQSSRFKVKKIQELRD